MTDGKPSQLRHDGQDVHGPHASDLEDLLVS